MDPNIISPRSQSESLETSLTDKQTITCLCTSKIYLTDSPLKASCDGSTAATALVNPIPMNFHNYVFKGALLEVNGCVFLQHYKRWVLCANIIYLCVFETDDLSVGGKRWTERGQCHSTNFASQSAQLELLIGVWRGQTVLRETNQFSIGVNGCVWLQVPCDWLVSSPECQRSAGYSVYLLLLIVLDLSNMFIYSLLFRAGSLRW